MVLVFRDTDGPGDVGVCGGGVVNPGVYSSFPLPLSFNIATSAKIGVQLARVLGESLLMGVRQSCPRLGETNAPVSSRTIALAAGFEALGGEGQGGGDWEEEEGDFPARLVGRGEGGVTRFITVL